MLDEHLSSGSHLEYDKTMHLTFLKTLTTEEIFLLKLLENLYDGDWSMLENDLEDRLRGHPIIYKINHRLQRDLESLKKLRSYEQKYNIKLINFLPTSPESEQGIDFTL